MRYNPISFVLPLVLANCSVAPSTTSPLTVMQSPVPVAAVQDATIALASYQAALGVMDVALQSQPVLKAKADALAAKAAPFVTAVQAGTTLAGAAPTLGALAAELLVEAAPYIAAVPNKA